MENIFECITFGQIVAGIGLVVGFIAGVKSLKKSIKEWIKDALKESFKALDEKIDSLQEKIDDVDLNACKNFLVTTMADIEKGDELDEISKQRFWEQYEHYLNNGGNSYIKQKVEKLKNEGKI